MKLMDSEERAERIKKEAQEWLTSQNGIFSSASGYQVSWIIREYIANKEGYTFYEANRSDR